MIVPRPSTTGERRAEISGRAKSDSLLSDQEAVFRAPLDDPDHARHAVESACRMQQVLEQLNQRWRTAGLAPLRIGIGIHTGDVFAGNVGGAGKVKYAVVGDTVILASRVEGLNKELGTTGPRDADQRPRPSRPQGQARPRADL